MAAGLLQMLLGGPWLLTKPQSSTPFGAMDASAMGLNDGWREELEFSGSRKTQTESVDYHINTGDKHGEIKVSGSKDADGETVQYTVRIKKVYEPETPTERQPVTESSDVGSATAMKATPKDHSPVMQHGQPPSSTPGHGKVVQRS